MVEEKGFRYVHADISCSVHVCGALASGVHRHTLFLVSEERVRSGIKKLAKGMQGATQGRLDSFFKVMPAPAKAVKRPVSVWQHIYTLNTIYSVCVTTPGWV